MIVDVSSQMTYSSVPSIFNITLAWKKQLQKVKLLSNMNVMKKYVLIDLCQSFMDLNYRHDVFGEFFF